MGYGESMGPPATLAEIERLVGAGAPPAAVQVLINGLPLEPGRKAALWLHFWGECRRRAAREGPPSIRS